VPQGRKQPPRLVNQDEHPRPDSTLQATRKVLARANLQLSDMDVIEINEAFATQVLGCLRQLGWTSPIRASIPTAGPSRSVIRWGPPARVWH
jgi:acetyl-CoA acetyltransferase